MRGSLNDETVIAEAECGLRAVKWSCFLGQFCGLSKMHLVCVHAAFSVSAWSKYLSLDKQMEDLQATTGIRYQRYMDDYVIFAPTRHKLRKAIKLMYAVLDDLKVEVHPKKRFIGTTRRGFDFLGYWLEPHRPLTPSQVSLTRLIDRSRQLLERTARVSHGCGSTFVGGCNGTTVG